MKSPICPTCGCSLVRLGISFDKALSVNFQGIPYLFCCQGCVDVFNAEPDRYLSDTSTWVVCPTCLAEKPIDQTIALEYEGTILHFCRCPHCVEEFMKNADYFVARFNGTAEFEGIFGSVCCDNNSGHGI